MSLLVAESLLGFLSLSVSPVSPDSLHLLLDFGRVHVNSRGHLHGLAAAGADVLQETEVGTARHDDGDDDDDGSPKGW